MKEMKSKESNDEQKKVKRKKRLRILKFRVNVPNLLKEFLSNNETIIFATQLQILEQILYEVSERATEINDPKMNALMCRLSLYEISDPYNSNYDSILTNDIIESGL